MSCKVCKRGLGLQRAVGYQGVCRTPVSVCPMPSLQDEKRVHSRTPRFAYLDTSRVASERIVGFVPDIELTCGSSQRSVQAIRLVKTIFRQGVDCVVTSSEGGISIACPEASETDILQLCSAAARRLARLQQEPLTAKMVEKMLSITSAERRRWSKDGRLSTAGRAFFSNGKNQITLFMYPPDTIRRLLDQPNQIAEWRQRDRGNSHIPQGTPNFPLTNR